MSDRIAGLKLGADDYIAKPFALEELMARVEAVIRRHRGKGGSRLQVGDVMLDLSEGLASRGDRQLGLTGIEFRILAALMRSPGQLVTYEQLAEAVWAVTTGPESNSLEVHVSRIRQKLEAGGGARLLDRAGYRLSLHRGMNERKRVRNEGTTGRGEHVGGGVVAGRRWRGSRLGQRDVVRL